MTTVPLTEQHAPDPAYQGPQDSSGEPGTTDAAPADVPRIGALSTERLTDALAARGPLQPTAIDAGGVERIVGPAVDDNWRHRSGEPDQDEIDRLAAVAAAQDDFRGERLAAMRAPGARIESGAAVTRAAFAAERGE